MIPENLLHFRLDGVDYTILGDMSEERMERIVACVENKINQIRRTAPNYSTTRVATLAALQLAEELADARDENDQVLAEAKSSGQHQYQNKFR